MDNAENGIASKVIGANQMKFVLTSGGNREVDNTAY